MSQRIADCFTQAKSAGRKVLIPFMTCLLYTSDAADEVSPV